MATKPQRSIRIPVIVESGPSISKKTHSAASSKLPPANRRAGVVKQAPRPVAEKPNRTKSHPIEHRPLAERKKWMMGFVAAGMLVAVLLWAMSLGAQLRPRANQPSLFTKVASLFKDFHLTNSEPTNPKQEEIKQLDKQVFPQFE